MDTSSDPYVKSLLSFGSSLESALSSNHSNSSNTNRRVRKRKKSLSWISILFIGIIIVWFIVIILIFGRLEDELLSDSSIEQQQSSRGLATESIEKVQQQQMKPQVVPHHSLPKYPIIHRTSSQHARPLTDQAILQCHKALWHTVNTTVSGKSAFVLFCCVNSCL